MFDRPGHANMKNLAKESTLYLPGGEVVQVDEILPLAASEFVVIDLHQN